MVFISIHGIFYRSTYTNTLLQGSNALHVMLMTLPAADSNILNLIPCTTLIYMYISKTHGLLDHTWYCLKVLEIFFKHCQAHLVAFKIIYQKWFLTLLESSYLKIHINHQATSSTLESTNNLQVIWMKKSHQAVQVFASRIKINKSLRSNHK